MLNGCSGNASLIKTPLKCGIQQSYELGFTPYRLHKNVDCTFATPIRYYDGRVYVLDDVATMEIGNRQIATDKLSS